MFPLWFSHDGPKTLKTSPDLKHPLTPICSCQDLHYLIFGWDGEGGGSPPPILNT